MHNHFTRDIKPKGECPSCDIYHISREHEEEIKEMSDVVLLREFRRRFNDSVLYECETGEALTAFGLERIKRYLKDNHGFTLRKTR